MKPFLFAVSLALVSICLDQPALGQETEQPIKCDRVTLASPWLAWGNAVALASGSQEIEAGQPYMLALRQSNGAQTSAETFAFTVKTAGTFRFALESAAWIDLIHEGSVLKPKYFGHGPNCSGIRKVVDFELAAGTYAIHISKSSTAKIKLMVVNA